MEVKDYIESGILELFVMGQTSEEESNEVLLMAEKHPEIRLELNAIEEALFKLSVAGAKEAPSHLKAEIFTKLEADSSASSHSDRTETTHENINGGRELKWSSNNWLVAASVTLLFLSSIANYRLYNLWQNTEKQVIALNFEKQTLTGNLKTEEAKYLAMQSQIEVLKNPETKTVQLKGLPLMPQALATVYWNEKNADVFFNAINLPETTTDEQYQLWAIVDGKPVDAGVFETNEVRSGMVKMKKIINATAFAVTIEKKGGSITPTLEKMVLMGAAS